MGETWGSHLHRAGGEAEEGGGWQDPEPLRPPWRRPYKNARRGETCTWLRAKCSCMPSRRKHGAILLTVSTSSSSPRNPRSSGAARRSPLELKAPILYSEPYYPTAPSCTRGLPSSPASQRNAMPSAPVLDPQNTLKPRTRRDTRSSQHPLACTNLQQAVLRRTAGNRGQGGRTTFPQEAQEQEPDAEARLARARLLEGRETRAGGGRADPNVDDPSNPKKSE